ncbi:hypothetical protein D3C83_120740 [compost metagenome]
MSSAATDFANSGTNLSFCFTGFTSLNVRHDTTPFISGNGLSRYGDGGSLGSMAGGLCASAQPCIPSNSDRNAISVFMRCSYTYAT